MERRSCISRLVRRSTSTTGRHPTGGRSPSCWRNADCVTCVSKRRLRSIWLIRRCTLSCSNSAPVEVAHSRCCPGRGDAAARSAAARPGLALADEATEDTAFELQGIGALQRDVARIGLAVFSVVDLTAPLVGGATRLHAEYDLNADDRSAAFGGIGI